MSSADNPLVSQPKPRRSSKPPAVQAAIIAKAMNGESKTQIANDLGIARNTVYSVLDTHEIEQVVHSGRSRAISLIPKSLDVAEYRLDKNDGAMAVAILRGTNVLQSQAQQVTNNNSFAINLLQLKQARENTLQNASPAQLQPITSPLEAKATPKPSKRKPKA